MIAGVTREGPSQSTPLYGSLKFSAGSLSCAPSAASGRLNVPSAPAVVEATTLPSLTASTLMPLRPSSLASMTLGLPPPPLVKSSQAVPVTRPSAVFAALAGAASDGIFAGATPTSGSSTSVPALTGSLVTNAPPPAGFSGCTGSGRALGKPADSLNVSCTPTATALAMPRSGSCSYTSRKMMPEASIEIAIGMKMTSLKAVLQRTRSVSTAKISPSAVATVGATTTQIALFLTAVRMVSSVKSSM